MLLTEDKRISNYMQIMFHNAISFRDLVPIVQLQTFAT